VSMYLTDGIGNQVAALTDDADQAWTTRYAPYGQQNVTSGDTTDQWRLNPYGFKTGVQGASTAKFTKYGYRWYLPGLGAWTQRDTLDAPLDPKNANRYAYAGDDPINGSDPTGRDYLTVGVSICAGVCVNFALSHEAGGNWGFTRGVGGGYDVGVTGYLGAQTGSLTESKSQDTTLGFSAPVGFQGTRSTTLGGQPISGGAAATVGAGIGVSSVSDYTSVW
jgi:RHS repeat-associated protein